MLSASSWFICCLLKPQWQKWKWWDVCHPGFLFLYFGCEALMVTCSLLNWLFWPDWAAHTFPQERSQSKQVFLWLPAEWGCSECKLSPIFPPGLKKKNFCVSMWSCRSEWWREQKKWVIYKHIHTHTAVRFQLIVWFSKIWTDGHISETGAASPFIYRKYTWLSLW